MGKQSYRGMSRVDILVTIGCAIGIVVAIMFVIANAGSVRRASAKHVKDRSQLFGIYQSWVTFSREFDGVFPTPGLADRLPVDGVEIPGRGAEDESQNTTANIFSLCIVNNYFAPELCVGATEPSTHVVGRQGSYNFAAYQPFIDIYWDTTFAADLHKVSNVSYAHMPLVGVDRPKHWRDTADPHWPLLGNRGPLSGAPNPKSITNRIHPPHDRWTGYVCFGDGSNALLNVLPTRPRDVDGFTIAPESYLGEPQTSPPTDATITFTKQIDVIDRVHGSQTARDVTIQHD
jgi:hypothetical protein